jgi:hypothetical protein
MSSVTIFSRRFRRFFTIPMRSQCPRVIGKICEIKGVQEICVISEICVRSKQRAVALFHADNADNADGGWVRPFLPLLGRGPGGGLLG